jgi:hypothetical protein
MTYTFLSAQYANAEHTAAVAITLEAAAVALSAVDTPAEWEAMHVWAALPGNAIAAYVEPPAPAPRWTPLEFLERFTQAERIAIRAASVGTSPEALQLADWLDLLRASTEVIADDPRTLAGTQALVDAGLLTPARRAAILGGG